MISLDETNKEFEEIEKGWYEEVKTINSKNKLNNFITKILCGYEHDYGTYVRAVAVCTKAFIRYYGSNMTYLQANYLMWELIRKTFDNNDALGLQLIKFEDILYPQLLNSFVVEFDEATHQKVIDTAKKFLEEHQDATEEVKEHWEKLATGWLPDCVKLKESEVKTNA